MDKRIYREYVAILKEELQPAMGCTEPIAVAYCAALARQTLGALPETVEVLAGVPGCAEQLPPAALRSVLRVGKLSLVDERALVRQLLSTVDSYLWARRSRVCSAPLGAVLADEADPSPTAAARLAARPFVAETSADAGADGSAGASGGRGVVLRPGFEMRRPMRVFYDENETGHWGAACCLGAVPSAAHPAAQQLCAFCALPLLAPAGTPQRNVAVMPGCGHAFHQACLAGTDACVVCLQHSMSRSVLHRHPL